MIANFLLNTTNLDPSEVRGDFLDTLKAFHKVLQDGIIFKLKKWYIWYFTNM